MRIVRLPADRFDPGASGPVVAIGNFDGVHVGHRAIFSRAAAEAARRGAPAAVLTFDPHPAKVLAPDRAPPLIQAERDKLDAIAAAGLDAVVIRRFDAAFAALSPADFVDQVLVHDLDAAVVLVGADFTFGRGRSGDRRTLRDLGARHGFAVQVVDPIAVDGIVASSTKVREFVLEGRVEAAAPLLGRPFAVAGTVVAGAGRGRTLDVPTANVRPDGELLPRVGVYAARVAAEGGPADAPAVVNVGAAPTFGEREVVVEAHLLDWSGDLAGRRLTVGLLSRLRDERRFPDAEALVAQIRDDIGRARQILSR